MNLSDFDTVEEARVYEAVEPKLIHRDSMNSLLASAGMYVALKGIAEDTTSPYQNLIAAFLDSTEYNFMIGNPTGERQIAALDSIISGGGVLGEGISAIKPVILALANPTVNPYKNATKHDFELSKGTMTYKTIPLQDKNFIVITTNADCERHSPKVRVKVGNTYVRKGSFGFVEKAGEYIAEVPRGYSEYFVDNAYGVVA